MPVSMEIRENGRVVFYQYRDPFNLHELNALYLQDENHRNSVDFLVHTVLDMSGVKNLPQGIIGARVGSPVLVHPRSGVIVVVGAGPLSQSIAGVVLRLTRKQAHFFKTESEGWDFVRKHLEKESAAVQSGLS